MLKSHKVIKRKLITLEQDRNTTIQYYSNFCLLIYDSLNGVNIKENKNEKKTWLNRQNNKKENYVVQKCNEYMTKSTNIKTSEVFNTIFQQDCVFNAFQNHVLFGLPSVMMAFHLL